MLWPLAVELKLLAREARGQGLDEVRVHGAAVRAREHAAVVRVEVEPLVRVDERLLAAVALKLRVSTFRYYGNYLGDNDLTH